MCISVIIKLNIPNEYIHCKNKFFNITMLFVILVAGNSE